MSKNMFLFHEQDRSSWKMKPLLCCTALQPVLKTDLIYLEYNSWPVLYSLAADDPKCDIIILLASDFTDEKAT